MWLYCSRIGRTFVLPSTRISWSQSDKTSYQGGGSLNGGWYEKGIEHKKKRTETQLDYCYDRKGKTPTGNEPNKEWKMSGNFSTWDCFRKMIISFEECEHLNSEQWMKMKNGWKRIKTKDWNKAPVQDWYDRRPTNWDICTTIDFVRFIIHIIIRYVKQSHESFVPYLMLKNVTASWIRIKFYRISLNRRSLV